MATSTMASPFEVFLSFCGEDTRKGFTDFLYTYLVGARIHTFRDDNELRVGEEIGPELLKAIKESKISIPIFSTNYASSKWCLRELAQIWDWHKKEGQMIFPIFYDVDPDTVRHQTKSYEEAFRQHREKDFDEKIVQGWEVALTEVGRLKGLELTKETGGREGELVKVVVEKVLLALKKNYTHFPENLVGMDSRIEKLNKLLQVDSSGVRIVGIHGMGGLGKTTIAKVIYNQLCERFERCCFLDDVQDKSKQDNDIVNLQNQLLSKIQNRGVPTFYDSYKGRDMIKDAVNGKKILIVLDNVDSKFQIDMLLGKHNWYGDRSRIIITTRNKDALDTVEMTCQREEQPNVYMGYKPELMDPDNSLQLFSKYAFMRDSPLEGYDTLAKEAVSIAAGLPLVLVTLGSSLLVEKDKDLWEAKLRKLKVIPHNKVVEKLRLSYEVLEYEQRHIFLDIASLFNGVNRVQPCYMWDACGFHSRVEISILVRRSLITIGDDDTFIMHDSLRDLGKQIIREESSELGKRSRLLGEDALHVLEARQGTTSVNALHLPEEMERGDDNLFRCKARCLVSQDFHQLSNLRYLSMRTQELDGDFNHLLSNLRWLKWRCSGKYTVTNSNMKNLVILDLSSSDLTENWEGWSELKMAKLVVLRLSGCSKIRKLPHLSTFVSLERLEVPYCWRLNGLDGLEQLKSLRYLDLRNCGDLRRLPDLSELRKLEHLLLTGCQMLTEIQGVDQLESLEVLDTSICPSLKRLPNLSNLRKLKIFRAYSSNMLTEIGGLERLDSLEELDTPSCLERFPNLSNFKKLKTLVAQQLLVTKIMGLGELEFLEDLDLSYLRFIEIIPDLSKLKKLKNLDIGFCSKLIQIQGLGGLESLEILAMNECKSIERLPDLSKLRKLKRINFVKCYKLVEIQGLEKLESLVHLDMSHCRSVKRLGDLPNFGRLKFIDLSYCENLQEVEGLGVVESLEKVHLPFCEALGQIPDLRRLKNLEDLKIYCLSKPNEIRGLEELISLKRLDITACISIEKLPDFSNLRKLERIDASGCIKLTEIRGLEELNSLSLLVIPGCTSLSNIPDLPNTTIMRHHRSKAEVRSAFLIPEDRALETMHQSPNKSLSYREFTR